MSDQIKKKCYKRVILTIFLKMLVAILLMQVQIGDLFPQKEFEKSVKFETLNFESYFRNNGHLGERPAGVHSAVWNAAAASGLYFYRLQAGDYIKTRKMVLIK